MLYVNQRTGRCHCHDMVTSSEATQVASSYAPYVSFYNMALTGDIRSPKPSCEFQFSGHNSNYKL